MTLCDSLRGACTLGKKRPQRCGRLARQLLRNEVPRRQQLAADRGAALGLPERQRLEQPVHHPPLTPEHQGVADDFLSLRPARTVVFQVDACTGAVVFAGAVDGFGAAEAALVFGQGLGLDVGQALGTPAAELGVQIGAPLWGSAPLQIFFYGVSRHGYWHRQMVQ